MKVINNVKSSCCGAPIMWNVTTDKNPQGMCLKCNEWASVIAMND